MAPATEQEVTGMAGTTGADWYSVHAEARAPDGADPIPAADTDRLADVLMREIEPHHGTCSVSTRSWTATISISSSGYDAADAAHTGARLAHSLATAAGLPADWPVTRAEAVREDALEDDLSRPQFPDVVTVPDIAEMLGVSQQRVHQLANTSEFPLPFLHLRTGRVWVRPAIERFAAEWSRQPGRPRKPAAV